MSKRHTLTLMLLLSLLSAPALAQMDPEAGLVDPEGGLGGEPEDPEAGFDAEAEAEAEPEEEPSWDPAHQRSAEDEDEGEPVDDSWAGDGIIPYSERPLTLPPGRLRIDVGPPDYGYQNHGSINGDYSTALGQGVRIKYNPAQGGAFSLTVGAAMGIVQDVEVGALLAPIQLAPNAAFGDMELYGRYQFLHGDIQIAGQFSMMLPTNTFFALGFGAPVQIRLAEGIRIDTGLELELLIDPGFNVNVDIPGAINFDINDAIWLGGRFGLLFPSPTATGFGRGLAINLGVQGGWAVHRMVDLTMGFNWPYLISTGTPSAFNGDIFDLTFGANVYLDLF